MEKGACDSALNGTTQYKLLWVECIKGPIQVGGSTIAQSLLLLCWLDGGTSAQLTAENVH